MSTLLESSPQFLPTESQLHMAYSVCRGITRANAKNFYYGFLLLPKRKRQALCAVYAFMRRCDDIADDSARSASERRQTLDAWVAAFHSAQSGLATDDPVLLALTDAQRRFQIPVGLLDGLAFGTGMDATEGPEEPFAPGLRLQYRSFEDLERYCYHVASIVGLVCIRIFGYSDPAAEPLAERCGLAFQLTNIIRDVKEDAGLGRIYLPAEDMEKFGISPAELAGTPDRQRLRPLLEFEARRAFENYRAAEELRPLVAEDSQPALSVLVGIYRGLLEKIARLKYDVFRRRISLSRREKLVILAKGFFERIS
ncbi:MAG: phytoene/squalene synthase family protein [Acidobacteria bacterium]|nr:phytoene/squalene synthase family protein [Acidobacteriota bacterium]MBV9625065.1 phytoene/squalene synthase family protein [Acidobacteriota bacterium]